MSAVITSYMGCKDEAHELEHVHGDRENHNENPKLLVMLGDGRKVRVRQEQLLDDLSLMPRRALGQFDLLTSIYTILAWKAWHLDTTFSDFMRA